MKHYISLLTMVLFLSGARAELSPSAYEAKQNAATEVLQIQILKVEIEPGEKTDSQQVTALARVIAVTRSAANVKPEDLITIIYTVTHHPAGWAGPGEIPILQEGKTVPAYLNSIADSKNLSPAAGRMSFSTF